MSTHTVTVVIAVWDGYCEYLPECVASVRRQRGPAAEIVVVDNASDVNLPPLPQPVTVVRSPQRLTAGAARNLGLAAVRTPLVLFLDADDQLLDGTLAHLQGLLCGRPEAVAAIGKHRLWSPASGTEKEVARSPRPLVYRLARHRRALALTTLRFDCFPLVGCALIRTEAARDAGGFGDADLAEDWILRSALAFRGRIVFTRRAAVRVRVQAGSLWRRGHSRQALERMYEQFRARRLADPRLPWWGRMAMPFLVRGHRRDVRRLTGAGAFVPPDHGLIAPPPDDAGGAGLSVVVCTHERPEHLAACLEALAEMGGDLEVVVVDSGSATPCRPVVEAYREWIDELDYVYVAEPGLSRARNAGIERSSRELVAFLDDDAVPQAGWDAALRAAFRRSADVGCVGGACHPAFAGARPGWLSDRLLQLSSITRFGERPREPRSSAEWPFGANMAFRRRALSDAGPFSEALGRTGSSLLSGEDSDMVARVQQAGWRIWLEPAAAVLHTVHAERLESRFYWRRLWWAGISRAGAPSARTTVRLLAALPIRLGLWTLTRDRIYLYRLAESAGYLGALSGVAGPGGRR